jgi:hypothetical protein
MSKTKSIIRNDDSTSLDPEWEDEGVNRMLPMRECSKTEEAIVWVALSTAARRREVTLLSLG